MTDSVFTRSQARGRGLTDSQIHRSVIKGELVRVRSGTLVAGDRWASMTPRERYAARVVSAADRCSTGAVISHHSAAAVHGLPMLHPDYSAVHFSEDGRGGGHGGPRRLHRVPLCVDDVTCVDGRPVTSIARTALDVACTGTFEQGVCVIESALRAGTSDVQMAEALVRMGRRRGIAVARRAAAFADARTESIGESWSRALMTRWPDVPLPRLQHTFRTSSGVFVARSDFDWDGRLVGEFDGTTKYGDDDVRDAVLSERHREGRLHRLGVHVVRWVWGDLMRPERLYRILRDGLNMVGL